MMWGLSLSLSLLRLTINVYSFWVVFVCMASIWFKITENKFKEAKSACFRIFQLVFSLFGLLGCMSRGWLLFGCDPSLLVLSFWLLAWLPRCVSNVKIFSKSPCTRRFATNRSVTVKKIKLVNFLQKLRIQTYAIILVCLIHYLIV